MEPGQDFWLFIYTVREPNSRLDIRTFSFSVRVINIWNALPYSVPYWIGLYSVNTVKRHLDFYFLKTGISKLSFDKVSFPLHLLTTNLIFRARTNHVNKTFISKPGLQSQGQDQAFLVIEMLGLEHCIFFFYFLSSFFSSVITMTMRLTIIAVSMRFYLCSRLRHL